MTPDAPLDPAPHFHSISKGRMLWVLGEALMDGVTRPDGTVEILPGGSPYNLARAAMLPIDIDALGTIPVALTDIVLLKNNNKIIGISFL
jgi:hypothetical protein